MAGVIVEQTTIDAAEDCLLLLADKIFLARNLSLVEESIYKASKITVGLQALNQPIAQTDEIARQRIILTLNNLCGIYNQQTVPTITI